MKFHFSACFFWGGDSAPKQLPDSHFVPSRRPRTGPPHQCNMDLVELARDLKVSPQVADEKSHRLVIS